MSRNFGFVGVALVACLGGCVELGTASEPEDQILEVIAHGRYREQGFSHVSSTDYPTAINDTDTIDVYVSDRATNAFVEIDPDRSGSAVALPVGSVIVREVIGSDGLVNKLTVMVRRDPGFFPAGGDWSYGVTDADGLAIETDSDGIPLAGALQSCATCHAERPDDDFLFGVPAQYLSDPHRP